MGVDNASKNSKYVKSFSKVYSRWESRSRCCGWILRFFFLPVRSCVKLFSVRSYSMSWCGAISPEVTTPLKNFIAFGLIWTTCTSLFCTDWMVCPNKSVKRPFTVDLHLQSLLHDAMEAKFLDLNKPWSCKYGKQKKWTRMTAFLWLHDCTQKQNDSPYYSSIDWWCKWLSPSRKTKFRHFATMVRGSHTFPLYWN